MPEFLRQVAEPPALVADEEERDDLEDPLVVPVEPVADVAELAQRAAVRSRLLRDLPERRRLARVARLDPALRERPDARALPARPDRRQDPASAQPPDKHAAGRELTPHEGTI